MKINIGFTGISGMLGKNFLEYFINNKEIKEKFNIIGFTRGKFDELRKTISYENYDSIIIKNIDYEDNKGLMESLSSIDILIHAAGVTKANSYSDFIKGNLDVTKKIIEVIEKENIKIKKFIYISSQSALGPSDNYIKNNKHLYYINETDLYNPITNYGRSKVEAEKIVKASNLNWIIVRFPAIFGKYDKDSLILFKLASKGIIIDTSWDEYVLSYILAQDASDLLFRVALNNDINNSILHFCYDEPIKIKDFMKSIVDLSKKKVLLKLFISKFILKTVSVIFTFVSFISKKKNIIGIEKTNEFLNTKWLLSNKITKQKLGIEKITKNSNLEDIYKWYKEKGLI